VKAKLSLFSAGVAVSIAAGMLQPAPLRAFRAQTDLDAFMKKVIARRDDSWKKLQQYILTEKDVIEVRGPAQMPVWGERREYSWFLRDGYFVRSPLSVNGVSIGEKDRLKYEAEFVRRERERDKRIAEREKEQAAGQGATEPKRSASEAPSSVEGLIAQTREPQFVSSAYFLKFKFEEGKYALVGREKVAGQDVLKIEYYPARLFSDETDRNKRRIDRGDKLSKDKQFDQAIETAANKVSLVTIWVEPKTSQIVKYVFDNVNLDFLPAAQFIRLADLKATMVMSQPFLGIKPSPSNPTPDVWLPKDVSMYAAMMIAIGQFDLRVSMDYLDYKLAETSSRIK
jgi:hypothetical protein